MQIHKPLPMKRNIIIISIIVFFATLSCVSAENITDNEAGSDCSCTYSFTNLQMDIDDANYELNLTHDYEYMPSDTYGVDIAKNIIINGNSHVIDARNSSMIFNIISSSVIINNLTLKNAHPAISAMNSNLTTRNVIFINNTDDESDGGAVNVFATDYHSISDMFIDNRAQYGSAICAEYESVLNLYNGTFKSAYTLKWGLIAVRYSEIMIADTTFSNITSSYSTVLHARNIRGTVKNARFINLHAEKTAGAIAVKGVEDSFTVENCSFTNITSRKNAGALYFDLISEDMSIFDLESIESTVSLKNSEFSDCSSEFGGAYLQLNGNLNINGCRFTNNTNAGYTSNTNCKMTGTVFEKNTGTCLYFDKGSLKISESQFSANAKVHINDAEYRISSAAFSNTDLYSFYDWKKCSLKNTTFTDSKPYLNRKSSTESIGNDLSKIKTPEVKGFPANTAGRKYFNLKDYGLVSSVKNQGESGSCWVFATVSAFESALLKIGVKTDISENSVYNAALMYSPVGVEYLFEGGESIYASQYFLSWLGIVSEEENDYDELGRISALMISDDYPHYSTNTVKFEYDITKVKEGLVKYGALYAPVYMDYDYFLYMNMSSYAYYNSVNEDQTHAVNIVGWDDTYSRNNFLKKPPKDGAWIVKNSWGEDWGDNGYCYISYYDASLYSFEILGFEILPEIYGRIYQHDYFSEYFENEAWFYSKGAEKITYAQTYTSKGDELISAVGTYFTYSDMKYTVRILLNGKTVYSQNGVSKHEGFKIIKLNTGISVNKKDRFTIEITRDEMAYGFISRAKYDTSYSYYKINGKKYKITDEIPAIKAYTTSNPLKSKNIVKYYAKSKTKYTISNIKAKKVTVKADNKKYVVKVKNGKATLKIGLKTGSHSLTTYYKGKKIINHILVKTTIKSKRTVKIPRNVKKTLEVKFLDGSGKVLKMRKVRFKFDSKVLVLKTDKNGILKLPVPIKLKKGKHILSFTNPKTKEKVKITLKKA